MADRARPVNGWSRPVISGQWESPLLAGRQLTEQDRADAPPVIVVNEALARRFFPGQRALGKRMGLENDGKLAWAEIVGVVGNVKHRRLDAEIKPELYEPYRQVRAIS